MPAARHDKAWRVMVALTIEQANMIADAVEERRTLFPDEPLRTSLLVVLLNISDRFAPVACVRCDCLGRGGARGAAGGDQLPFDQASPAAATAAARAARHVRAPRFGGCRRCRPTGMSS